MQASSAGECSPLLVSDTSMDISMSQLYNCMRSIFRVRVVRYSDLPATSNVSTPVSKVYQCSLQSKLIGFFYLGCALTSFRHKAATKDLKEQIEWLKHLVYPISRVGSLMLDLHVQLYVWSLIYRVGEVHVTFYVIKNCYFVQTIRKSTPFLKTSPSHLKVII